MSRVIRIDFSGDRSLDTGLALAMQGFPIIPVKRKTKITHLTNWPSYGNRAPSLAQVRQWVKENPHCGFGMVCGHLAVVVDLDNENKNIARLLHRLANKMLGETVVRVGRYPRRVLIYRVSGDPIETNKMGDVEFRGVGSQVVVDGVHPDMGKPYWYFGPHLAAIELEDLPAVTADMAKAFMSTQAPLAKMLSTLPQYAWDRLKGHDTGNAEENEDRSLRQVYCIRDLLAHGFSQDQVATIIGLYPDGAGAKAADNTSKWFTDRIQEEAKRTQAGSNTRGRSGVVIHSMAALAKEDLPEIESVVAGIIVEGVTLLAGKPKIGKSRLALQLCATVAEGGLFLGREVQKGRGLYISLEDSKRRLQSRSAELTTGSIDFHYALEWPKLSNGGVEELRKVIASGQFNFIVIDTLAKFRGVSSKGNQSDTYASDYDAISQVVSLANEFGVCLILIHHLRKTPSDDDYFDQVAGSTGLTAAPDTIIVLKNFKGTKDAVLLGRGRDVEEFELGLTLEDGFWTHDPRVGMDKPKKRTIKDGIYDALIGSPPVSPVQIEKMTGLKGNSVRPNLGQLVDAGLLVRSDDGLYSVK